MKYHFYSLNPDGETYKVNPEHRGLTDRDVLCGRNVRQNLPGNQNYLHCKNSRKKAILTASKTGNIFKRESVQKQIIKDIVDCGFLFWHRNKDGIFHQLTEKKVNEKLKKAFGDLVRKENKKSVPQQNRRNSSQKPVGRSMTVREEVSGSVGRSDKEQKEVFGKHFFPVKEERSQGHYI